MSRHATRERALRACRCRVRLAARLFEVGTLIVAGYNEAVDEMMKQREAFDKLPPPGEIGVSRATVYRALQREAA